MGKNLLILGAGQYGYITKETAEAIGFFDKIAFLDDKSGFAIGKLSDLEKFLGEFSSVFVAIGNSEVRLRWITEAESLGFELPTLIHPRSYVSPTATVEKGSLIEPMAVVQANTKVGRGTLISAGAIINHNCEIGDGVHVDCNVLVPSNEKVSDGKHLF